jgi:hypothetical protein
MSAPGATIPGIMIGFFDGDLIRSTAAGTSVSGTLSPNFQVPRINRITGFSSRGPNGGAPDILKPDLAAPGVDIIAGETLFPNVTADGGQFFQHLSGTSMASPHVAGVMALIKQLHPDWSPAMARSALMTTARQDLKKTFGPAPADPFDIGAGFIVPRDALSPGLAYDAGFLDYLAFLCGAENQILIVDPGDCAFLESVGFSLDSSDLNLPSIGIAALVGAQTVTRTVTNVQSRRRTFQVSVQRPAGIQVDVTPKSLTLAAGEWGTYEVTFTTRSDAVLNEWTFGSLQWSDGGGNIDRSPIAVRPVPLAAPSEVRGAGTNGSTSFDVTFGYTGGYDVSVNGLVPGTRKTGTVSDSVTSLRFEQKNFEVPPGTTLARFAMYDDDNNASNDMDMQVFFLGPAGAVFVGASGGVTSEEEVNVVNPTPGRYAVLVIDFLTAPGPTPFVLFNFNLTGTDAHNAVLTPPAAAVSATTSSIGVTWTGLRMGTRSLGILNHSDGTSTIGQTDLLINTQ